MIPQQKVTSVELLGGPHDGLVVECWAVPQPWPTVLRLSRITSMIGKHGVIAASECYRVDEYLRCSEARYRYARTKR